MNKPKAVEIRVKYLQGQNYTPADAMRRWAMENYETFYTDLYKGAYIHMMGCDYYYDHWKIEKQQGDAEIVTLYLKCKGVEPERPDSPKNRISWTENVTYERLN